jgi:hypothetical protein
VKGWAVSNRITHHFSNELNRRVQNLTKSSSWADETYFHLANALRGKASKWLFSMADMETKNTTINMVKLRGPFQKIFATQTGDKVIIHRLASLAM